METFRCGHPRFSWNTSAVGSMYNPRGRCMYCLYRKSMKDQGYTPKTFEAWTVMRINKLTAPSPSRLTPSLTDHTPPVGPLARSAR